MNKVIIALAFVFCGLKWLIEVSVMLITLAFSLVLIIPIWVVGAIVRWCNSTPPNDKP